MRQIPQITRRRALQLALGCLAIGAGATTGAEQVKAKLYRRVGIAFGTSVSIILEAPDAPSAEAAFAAGFAEIRHIDRIASLRRNDSEVFRLNRDGHLNRPDPALVEMLQMAHAMHAATNGAFDVTVQPLWLAFDAAAKRGSWPGKSEINDIRRQIDQRAMNFDDDRIEFAKPGMAITLNSLARGLAADRVAKALAAQGIVNAFLDTDALESMGTQPDGAIWRALIQHPRKRGQSIGDTEVKGCLATSGDYEYFWSSDFARNHIIDPRIGASPADFASVSVLASSGLLADALSTAVFLVGSKKAPVLLEKFAAEALFVDKDIKTTMTSGFPALLAL